MRLNGADPWPPDLGSIEMAVPAATAARSGGAAQNAAPADPFGEDASDAGPDQLPDQGRADVAAQGDLPDGKGEAVADQGHAHRHDPACRHPAQNAADEEHRQIGGQGRREQAQSQDGSGDLDHHDLAEGISCRSEKRLAQAEGQREGGGQQRDNADRGGEVGRDGCDERVEEAGRKGTREPAQGEDEEEHGGLRPTR